VPRALTHRPIMPLYLRRNKAAIAEARHVATGMWLSTATSASSGTNGRADAKRSDCYVSTVTWLALVAMLAASSVAA